MAEYVSNCVKSMMYGVDLSAAEKIEVERALGRLRGLEPEGSDDETMNVDPYGPEGHFRDYAED